MIFETNLKVLHVRWKTRSYLKKIMCMFCSILLKVGPNVFLDDISKQFGNELFGSKTRPSQILEISFVGSWDHIFSPVLLKVGHNVILDDVYYEFGNGSCLVKNWVIWSNHRNTYACNPGVLIQFLLINTLPHNPEGSGERLQGHYGLLFNLTVKINYIFIWKKVNLFMRNMK